jgi:hypothetical protein
MATVLRAAQIGASGKTVAFVFEDGAGDLANVSAVASHPTLTVDGSPVTLSNPMWGDGSAEALPYVLYPLASVIAEGATVTATAAGGWATTTAGAAPAMTAQSVGNGPGRSYLPPFEAVPKTMPVGYNIQGISYYMNAPVYANLVKHSSALRGLDGGMPFTTDADGYPTEITGPSGLWAQVGEARSANGTVKPGYVNLPEGVYTLKWDGADLAELVFLDDTPGSLLAETLTGGADNVRTYTVSRPTANYDIRLGYRVRGAGVRNIRIYAPGTPTDGSVKFSPDLLAKLAGARCLRFGDLIHVNNSVVDAQHLRSPSALTYAEAKTTVTATLTAVATEPNADGFFRTDGRTPMRFTTAAPHGFITGQLAVLGGFTDPIALAGGGTFPAEGGPPNLYNGVLRVISPTQFAVSFWTVSGAAVVPGSITGTATVTVEPGIPVEDAGALCNAVGADCYLCVPHAMDDAGVAEMADRLIANLAPGRKLRIEYSNEVWNFVWGDYCHGMGALAGLSRFQWYARRTSQVHDIFAARLAAAGRAAGDLVRLFAGQASNPGTVAEIVGECAAQGIPLDEYAIAPYLNNGPSTAPAAAWDALDIGGVLDASELYLRYGVSYNVRYSRVVDEHEAILHPSFPAAKVVCYEGSPETGCYGTDAAVVAAKARAWARHPRMRGIWLRYMQQLQDQGCGLFMYYVLAREVAALGGPHPNTMWAAYNGFGQLTGLGDGSDGRNDNRTDYDAVDQVVSVVGGAIDAWESLFAGTAPRKRLRFRRHV